MSICRWCLLGEMKDSALSTIDPFLLTLLCRALEYLAEPSESIP